MPLTKQALQHLHDLLKAGFPGFESFADPRFRERETDYKREASQKAQTWFSKTALEAVVEDEPESLIPRIRDLANETNLLFLGVPKQGDLALVYSDDVKSEELGQRIIDLLHGPGESPQRLQRFSDWVEEEGLPNKWTLPTYLLFLVHPETELYVKPMATSDFLKLVGAGDEWDSMPSADLYAKLLGLAGEVKAGLSDLAPADMIDIQSVIYLDHVWGKDLHLEPERREELMQLFHEFRQEYVPTAEGQEHLTRYAAERKEAIANFRLLQEARKQGQEITEMALAKLLPHRDSEANRDRGAWISVAAAIQGDVRQWFENKGWVEPGNWPKVAAALFDFIAHLKEHPEELQEQVERLANSGLGTGFQSGMLTPILNALRPERFLILNVKSRRAINYFLGLTYDHVLTDYPPLNRAGWFLINQLEDELAHEMPESVRPSDGFDAFGHWLVAIRKYSFGATQAWRVQVDDPETWRAWESAGVIGYSLEALGNAAGYSVEDWKSPPSDVDPRVTDAVRHLATKLAEGDVIAVFDEQAVLRGTGEVTGVYTYREGEPLDHVVPVEWNDTTARKSTGRPQKKLITSMPPGEFQDLSELPELRSTEAEDAAFSVRAFDLLAGLTDNPTKTHYQEHREEFSEHLEEPFKRFFRSVAADLPGPMLEILEVEKRLFSKILKNDFGRGGAWDYYWGAVYPKGQKRIAGAQLFVWMNRERVEWGFYVGEYADDVSEAMLSQVRRRKEALRVILNEHIEADRFLLGAERGPDGSLDEDSGTRSIDEWLQTIDAGSLSARTSLPRQEVLSLPEPELRERIVSDFRQLFPLVLIASYDDPIRAIESLTGTEDDIEVQPEYSLQDCASETGFDLKTLSMWYDAIERKGQAVFYGPPGTGKTYMAEALARVLVSEGDGVTELVQFHPAYAYEDFMQGIRPRADREGNLEFSMEPGRFLEFCRTAQGRKNTCVLIIDEINRGNLSRVFGELMYLLEYRNRTIPLAGGGSFKIPENVRIIGTMNTADRSIALVDHALRRRFAFLALRPRDDVLRRFHEDTGQSVDVILETLAAVNTAIGDENYHVGITFFMDEDLDKNLEAIWRLEIEPYLEEYFFDDATTVDRFRWSRVVTDLTGGA